MASTVARALSTAGFEFREPKGGDRLSDRSVRFFGYADSGRVRVDVYDRDGNRVNGETMSVRDGRWEGRIRLDDGRFRAVANLEDTNRRITVWFNVGEDRRSDTERRVHIALPNRDEALDGPSIEIRGTSDASDVLIQIYGDGDKRLVRNSQRVRDGRWRASFMLRPGSYTRRCRGGQGTRPKRDQVLGAVAQNSFAPNSTLLRSGAGGASACGGAAGPPSCYVD